MRGRKVTKACVSSPGSAPRAKATLLCGPALYRALPGLPHWRTTTANNVPPKPQPSGASLVGAPPQQHPYTTTPTKLTLALVVDGVALVHGAKVVAHEARVGALVAADDEAQAVAGQERLAQGLVGGAADPRLSMHEVGVKGAMSPALK